MALESITDGISLPALLFEHMTLPHLIYANLVHLIGLGMQVIT